MTAPALLLVSPNVPESLALLSRLQEHIRRRRPSLICAAADTALASAVGMKKLLSPEVTEIVCVPLRAAGFTPSAPATDHIRSYFATHNPDARIYDGDGLGAGSSLFNAVDQQL
ncbi:MAG: hypothetical protein ACRCWS_05880, partial [Propionibacteriaceae bacterium]